MVESNHSSKMSTKSYKAIKYYKDGVNAIRKNRQIPKNNILGDTDPNNSQVEIIAYK